MARVDFQVKQVTDCALVLIASEPLEATVAQVGSRLGRCVYRRLQGLHENLESVAGRTGDPGRRHHPHAQLPDHPLGNLSLIRRVLNTKPLERHVPR